MQGRREEEVGGGRPKMAGVGGPDRSQAAGVGRGREGQREAQGRGVEKWEVRAFENAFVDSSTPHPTLWGWSKRQVGVLLFWGTVGFGGPCWVVVEPGRRWFTSEPWGSLEHHYCLLWGLGGGGAREGTFWGLAGIVGPHGLGDC